MALRYTLASEPPASRRLRRCAPLFLGMLSAALGAAGALAQATAPVDEESSKDIVATTVRSLGHPCERPERAVRDEAASLPDQAAWILTCSNARYWVRYNNDEPAEIRRISPP